MRPQSDPLPVLQVVGLFYAICYGFGGLITPDRFMGGIVVSEDQYTPGLIGAIGSLAMIYMAFSLGKRIPWPKTPSIYRIDDVRTDELALYIALPASIIVDQVATRIDGSVQSITSPIRAFFFVWSLYSALSGRYSRVGRIITYFVFTPLYLILYLNIANGRLLGLLTTAFLVGLTYVAAKKRVPFVPLILLLGIFFVLQPVKGYYRELTWSRQNDMGAVEGILTFAELANDQYVGENAKPLAANLNNAYSRIDHLQTASAIISATPDAVDFRRGATYLPLLTKWIPRAIWPDKPREDFGNAWAHSYRYVGPRDFTSSFNLPWYPEMYMNFGWLGVVGVSAMVGLLLSAIWNIFAKGAVLPSQFAAGMMFCSVFYFPESNLSIEIGNLIVMVFILSAINWVLSALSKRRRLRVVAATPSSRRRPAPEPLG